MGPTAIIRVGAEQVEPADYDRLKRFGFSPAKASEIKLDATRGDWHAIQFVELARTYAPKETA